MAERRQGPADKLIEFHIGITVNGIVVEAQDQTSQFGSKGVAGLGGICMAARIQEDTSVAGVALPRMAFTR
jgi:hypothetical protein